MLSRIRIPLVRLSPHLHFHTRPRFNTTSASFTTFTMATPTPTTSSNSNVTPVAPPPAALHHSPPSSPSLGPEKVPTKRPKHNNAKTSKNGKPSRKTRIQAVEPVLLKDILTALGWSELPSPDVSSSDEQFGQKKWPRLGPKDRKGTEEQEGVEVGATGWSFTDDEFHVSGLTSHGDGIAVVSSDAGKPIWAMIIPFTLPGDVVRARVVRHGRFHSFAEPLSRLSSTPSASFPVSLTRDESLIGCKYFGTCAGCQYQSLPYAQQLALKQWVLTKAMANFSGLPSSAIPEAKQTIPSPKEYGYRTKITPHFDVPRGGYKPGRIPSVEEIKIGFEEKCRSKIIDIEDCPIATRAINDAMPEGRRKIKESIASYKRGATMLMRDSLVTKPNEGGATVSVRVGPSVETEEEAAMNSASASAGTSAEGTSAAAAVGEVGEVVVRKKKGKHLTLPLEVELQDPEEHICVTDHSQTVTEKVGNLIFQFPAGSFFQNNASILVPLTEFVRDQIQKDDEDESFLVDAYCGSGLFSLALASHFTNVCGIEIDPNSIAYATHNATLNKISNVSFHAGASESIFDPIIKKLAWNGDKTTLIVDPPRKGCDDGFLKQVVAFKPKRIVYVSCNVHTMAANAGDLIRWSDKEYAGKGYTIKSLGAIDLFPQTHHTEGLLVLEREL